MKDDSNKDIESTIKELLTNNKVAFNVQDWNEIEKLLDAQPREHSFKWNLSLTIFTGIIVLTATFLIFYFAGSDNNNEATTTSTGNKDISIATADSIVPPEKDTTALQVSTATDELLHKNSSQQEIVLSRNNIAIDETDKQKEKKEKLRQKNTETSETRKHRSNGKDDSLKITDLFQKNGSVNVNADTANNEHSGITGEKEIISTGEKQDNAEPVSDEVKTEEKTSASDSTSQKSNPSQKRKLKLKPKR